MNDIAAHDRSTDMSSIFPADMTETEIAEAMAELNEVIDAARAARDEEEVA